MAAITSRYARALGFVVAADGLDPRAAQEQLASFGTLLKGNRELREVLTDPSIPSPQKLKVLDGLAERMGLAKAVRNFIAVVMDHERLGELGEIETEYAAVAAADEHIADAEIVSARPLNEEDRVQLVERVKQLAASEVHITYTEDPALLGGAVIRIGSTVWDGSLRAQLEQVRQKMITASLG